MTEKNSIIISKEKRQKVLLLYSEGKEPKKIAEIVGVKLAVVQSVIAAEFPDSLEGAIANFKLRELVRLEVVYRELEERFLAGDTKAADLILKIHKQKYQLLFDKVLADDDLGFEAEAARLGIGGKK